MAVAISRYAGAQRASGTPHAITLPATADLGNLVVLALTTKTGATISISSISGLGATWVKQSHSYVTGSNTRAEIWYGIVVTPGTAITITPSATVALTWDAYCVTGHDP